MLFLWTDRRLIRGESADDPLQKRIRPISAIDQQYRFEAIIDDKVASHSDNICILSLYIF